MKETLRIEADYKTGRVSVGNWSSDLFIQKVAEWDCWLKNAVLTSNDLPVPSAEASHMERNAHYCRHLGPVFNRRVSGASWNAMTSWARQDVWPFLFHMGRHFRFPDAGKIEAASRCRGIILEAQSDQLLNLVPLIIATEMHPSEIRKAVGKGLWRKLASNSKTRNNLICTKLPLRKFPDVGAWVERLEIVQGMKSGSVRLMDHFEDWEIASHADSIAPIKEFRRTMHIISDAQRMGSYNKAWGLRRLVEEHDKAARQVAARKYSAKPFCAEQSQEVDGFIFDRLASRFDVAVEGDTQGHCLASYIPECAKGSYAAFKVTGKERATLGAWLDRNANKWRLDQIYGARNSIVSPKCRAAAEKFLRNAMVS